MTNEQALNRVRALLALSTTDHRESAHNNRNLVENAIQAENINIETAKTLGIFDAYQSTVNNIAPRLFYELKGN